MGLRDWRLRRRNNIHKLASLGFRWLHLHPYMREWKGGAMTFKNLDRKDKIRSDHDSFSRLFWKLLGSTANQISPLKNKAILYNKSYKIIGEWQFLLEDLHLTFDSLYYFWSLRFGFQRGGVESKVRAFFKRSSMTIIKGFSIQPRQILLIILRF